MILRCSSYICTQKTSLRWNSEIIRRNIEDIGRGCRVPQYTTKSFALTFYNMRLRPDKFYVIRCQRKEDVQTIEIDDADSQEVVYTFCELFPERLTPTKDENGRFKKGLPYTKVSIVEYDKRTKQSHRLTHGNIYNLSPTQIKERLKKTIKFNSQK